MPLSMQWRSCSMPYLCTPNISCMGMDTSVYQMLTTACNRVERMPCAGVQRVALLDFDVHHGEVPACTKLSNSTSLIGGLPESPHLRTPNRPCPLHTGCRHRHRWHAAPTTCLALHWQTHSPMLVGDPCLLLAGSVQHAIGAPASLPACHSFSPALGSSLSSWACTPLTALYASRQGFACHVKHAQLPCFLPRFRHHL